MRLLFILFLLLQVSFSSEYEYSENIIEALQRGDYLFSQNKVEDALIEYENVILMDETNVKGLIGIFKCQLKTSKLAKARYTLDSINNYSLNKKLIMQLDKVLNETERMQDQQAAREFFDKQKQDFLNPVTAIRKDKKKKVVQTEQVFETNSPQGKFAKAVQLHKKKYTSQAIPLFMDAIMTQGNLLFAKDYGLLEASQRYYQKNIQINPRSIKDLFILAWIWDQFVNPEQSKKLYTRIMELEPSSSNYYQISKGKLLAIAKEEERLKGIRASNEKVAQKDKARQKMLQISNGVYSGYNKDDYLTKGREFLDNDKVKDAIIHLQGAVKIAPKDAKSHYYYALAQVESGFNGNEGGFANAIAQVKLCLDLDPDPYIRQEATNLLTSLNQR
ncbi:MAG: hypothetical protein KC646_15320 [Candidatus Cloacimonetes bacterium]|nr:hypothetical protein [Candidatus Cloacimonadota bacterium]